MGLAIRERLQHAAGARAQQIGHDAGHLDVRFLEQRGEERGREGISRSRPPLACGMSNGLLVRCVQHAVVFRIY
ncbi:MAG TPA: hypothetical protein VE714_07255 [Gemmatimonadales bacterium]|jgi:hypothetical protein|nr:hypothetical protein [Gemmatimonadales bacterium]